MGSARIASIVGPSTSWGQGYTQSSELTEGDGELTEGDGELTEGDGELTEGDGEPS